MLGCFKLEKRFCVWNIVKYFVVELIAETANRPVDGNMGRLQVRRNIELMLKN